MSDNGQHITTQTNRCRKAVLDESTGKRTLNQPTSIVAHGRPASVGKNQQGYRAAEGKKRGWERNENVNDLQLTAVVKPTKLTTEIFSSSPVTVHPQSRPPRGGWVGVGEVSGAQLGPMKASYNFC